MTPGDRAALREAAEDAERVACGLENGDAYYQAGVVRDLAAAVLSLLADADRVPALEAENARLREALRQIEEAAADTPEPECLEPALASIYRVCVASLSSEPDAAAALDEVVRRAVEKERDAIMEIVEQRESEWMRCKDEPCGYYEAECGAIIDAIRARGGEA